MSVPNLNFSHSTCRLRKIKTIQFGVQSPDLLVNRQIILIHFCNLFDKFYIMRILLYTFLNKFNINFKTIETRISYTKSNDQW